MVWRAHVSGAEIRRYIDGTPDANLERHVRVCVYCAQRLGDAAVMRDHWERRGPLRRLVRIDLSHEVDELLGAIAEEQGRHAA